MSTIFFQYLQYSRLEDTRDCRDSCNVRDIQHTQDFRNSYPTRDSRDFTNISNDREFRDVQVCSSLETILRVHHSRAKVSKILTLIVHIRFQFPFQNSVLDASS